MDGQQAALRVEGATRRFPGTAEPAVDGVDLEVARGEFVALLGPSGCGKTTLLRAIAGFERLDAGRIHLDGRLVAGNGVHVPAEQRRVGLVFQSYALWPHMSVAGNVAYPLDTAGVPRAERARRVAAALATVGLAGYAERRPAALSGGQRQRVALARCLVMEPALVLLDEPLANLDIHLRAAMEEEFAAFHRQTGATLLYVTHDQAEAMALADRIAVLDRGRLAQIAAPRTLYREPATAMVAGFVGAGAVVPGEVVAVDGRGRAQGALLGTEATLRCRPGQRPGAHPVCLRPEDLTVDPAGPLAVTLVRVAYRGAHVSAEAEPAGYPGLRLPLHLPADAAAARGDTLRLGLRDGWVVPEGLSEAVAVSPARE